MNLPAGFARKKRVGLLNVKALGLKEDHRWSLKLKHFNESLEQFDLRSLESVDSAKFFKESPALDRHPLFLPSPPSTDPPTAIREEALTDAPNATLAVKRLVMELALFDWERA